MQVIFICMFFAINELSIVTCFSTHFWMTGSNFLNGTIPSELSYLQNLGRWCDLNIHPVFLKNGWIFNVTFFFRLESLSLGNNGLTGTIPPELGRLRELQTLRLHDNDLSGTIPSQIGSLYNLKTLWLQRNNLEGSLPSEIGNCIRLEEFTMSGNNIGSTIPLELFNCTKLNGLWFYNNRMTGTIPTHFNLLPSLKRGKHMYDFCIVYTVRLLLTLKALCVSPLYIY